MEQKPTPSRRERLKQEREERILDAAAAIFAEKGYHRATIRDIATQADVADGTIYNYYDSKFDLLIAILSRIAELEQLPAELMGGLQDDVRGFFVTAFRDRMDRIERGEEMLQAVLPQVFVHPELRERFYRQTVRRIARLLEGYVEAQVEAGAIRPVDPELLTRLLQATFVGLLVLRILGDEPLQERWETIPDLWATVMFDGLNPRGEA
ncbi:MAG: TetR/AcrR family transcriptional regulator [Anaerolineae bacterium]|jgi:AcrR family transcriptional regulator